MKCVFCGGTKFERKTVDFPVYEGGKIVDIVRDVEADVCVQCGEPYFPEEVVVEIEEKVPLQKVEKGR